MAKKVSSILIGVSGEYYVAAELSRRGYVASITLRNTRGIDIVASNEAGTKTINIQVKTKRENNKAWILSKKNESVTDANLFYVFVSLVSNGGTEFHIVPSKAVAEYITTTHKKWLQAPGRSGKPHKDNDVRKFMDDKGAYLSRWDLLGLG
jgi:hypothetical protein